MTSRRANLIDRLGNVVATAEVREQDGPFAGRVDLALMPEALRRKFGEYEEIVNGQMFSLLEEIEGEVRALRLRVVFPDARESYAEDLQIYPTTGSVSFRLACGVPGCVQPTGGSPGEGRSESNAREA